VVIATRPGTSAFQPIVFVAIAGVVCNAFYGLTTRMLAGRDSAETTLVWTSIAGVVAATPFLPWFWVTPQGPKVWAIMALLGASGAFGHWLMILAHQRAPASAMAPFGYTQLLWMIVIGWCSATRRPARRWSGPASSSAAASSSLGASGAAGAEAPALVSAARSPI
jgi:drug/metabolite transporter (DMT)-like permease